MENLEIAESLEVQDIHRNMGVNLDKNGIPIIPLPQYGTIEIKCDSKDLDASNLYVSNKNQNLIYDESRSGEINFENLDFKNSICTHRINEYIKDDNLEEYKIYTSYLSIDYLKGEAINHFCIAVLYKSFKIVEWLLPTIKEYIDNKKYNINLQLVLIKPEDKTSYEYSKYLVVRDLLKTNNIKYMRAKEEVVYNVY